MAIIHRKLDYVAQPKQQMMHACPANAILYGGSAGPGKSYAIRHDLGNWCLKIPKLQVYLFRRTYPELEKNHVLPVMMDWGERYGRYNKVDKRYLFPNGSIIHFCHAQHEQDVMSYHGAEIHILAIDELSTFTEWQFVYLRNRVRCTLDIPEQYRGRIPGILAGSNPGGPGHEFCKRLFVDFCRLQTEDAEDRMARGKHVYEHPHRRLGYTIYYGLRRAKPNDGGMLHAYIPGLLEDNQVLMQSDPGYINRVKAMPEPYRSAYLDGDWDIFVGQMFNFNRRDHVCRPFPVPDHAKLSMTMDWGFGAPYSLGWWFCDGENRAFRCGEVYGWTKVPNKGVRHTDSEIAEVIIKKEKAMGFRSEDGGLKVGECNIGRILREVEYILSPDCFSKKPDYKGGGQGPSTAEIFAEYGIVGRPGDATRDQKVRQFHERLRIRDGERPMLQVFDTCSQFIRTVPLLQQDEHDPEDVDTTGEDHIYDEAALYLMSRPLSLEVPVAKQSSYDRRLDDLKKGVDLGSYEAHAEYDHQVEMQRLEGDEWDALGGAEYDDGELVNTVD